MKKEDLLIYEAYWFTEYISNSWLQEIIARCLARKVNKKWRRYEERIAREKFIRKYLGVQKDEDYITMTWKDKSVYKTKLR